MDLNWIMDQDEWTESTTVTISQGDGMIPTGRSLQNNNVEQENIFYGWNEVTTAKESKNIFGHWSPKLKQRHLKQSPEPEKLGLWYQRSSEDFDKALKLNPHDLESIIIWHVRTPWKKAMESFKHLDQAVSLGFNEGAKIMSQEELAYIRIIPVFEKI